MRKEVAKIRHVLDGVFVNRGAGKVTTPGERHRSMDIRRVSMVLQPAKLLALVTAVVLIVIELMIIGSSGVTLLLVGILTLLSRTFRRFLLKALSFPFSISMRIAFFLASPRNGFLLRKIADDSAKLPESKIPKPDMKLGYTWRGKWLFGGFSDAGLTFDSLVDGVTVLGSYGAQVVRKLVYEAAKGGFGVLVLDTSGRIGLPKDLTSTRVHRIGVDTTVNPMHVEGVSARAWSTAFATASSVACTLDLEDASLLGDFFFTRTELEGRLRISETRLWVEGIGDYIDPRRAFTIKANMKKLLLGRAENIFTDAGISINSLMPQDSSVVYVDLTWMDREQKTFLLVLLLGALQHLNDARGRNQPPVIVVDDLQNLLPEMNILPYDYRPVWENVMYLIMTASEVAGLILHSSSSWVTTYAYSLLPNMIVTRVAGIDSAKTLSKALSLGRDGDELLMSLAPQECIARTMSRFGPSYYMMVINPVEVEVLPHPDLKRRRKKRKTSVTKLEGDFRGRATLAYEVLNVLARLVEADSTIIKGYLTEYPSSEVVEVINKLRSNAYLVEATKGVLELSEKGSSAIDEWGARKLVDSDARLTDDELRRKLDETLRHLLTRAEEEMKEGQHAACISSCHRIVWKAVSTLLGGKRIPRKLPILVEQLNRVGVRPCRRQELGRLHFLALKARRGNLTVSSSDAEFCMSVARSVLSKLVRGWST